MDELIETLNVFVDQVKTNLVVFNDTRNLELLDSVTDRNQLGGTPEETVQFDGADLLLHLSEVSLIIPGLDVQDDRGLGDGSGSLGSLLGIVGGKTLSLSTGNLLILRLAGEGIKVILLLGGGGRGGSAGSGSLLGSGKSKRMSKRS